MADRYRTRSLGLTAMAIDKTGRTSAGILLYRHRAGRLEVLLAHPGGPFHRSRDVGAWTIPKGEVEPGERLIDVARREFAEETGHASPDGEPIDLGEVRQKSGKRVVGWALAGDLDPETATSNTYELEWPPGSGHPVTYPEIDRVAWFDMPIARTRLKPAQVPFLDRLVAALELRPG
jgi:predicted NUDIX family NTP pyrophosphohydrolase